MFRKYLLPILAILGAIFGILTVRTTQKQLPVPPILFPPAVSPFPHSIAAAGIIESSSQNIAIGSPFNEIITKIYVTEGNHVKVGDPLFELDTRFFVAQLERAQASLELAKTDYEDKKKQFSFYERLQDKRAVSEQEYQQVRYAMLEAEKNVLVAVGDIEEIKTNIERSCVRAPVEGEILQVNAHIGEIAPINPFPSTQSTWRTAANGSLMLMGNVKPLQIRVDIDEDDAWRFHSGAKAIAFVRGNRNIAFPITYDRIEPYMIPKSSFTGQTVERVDTRVLQVLYQFERGDLPIFPGQVLDIFIEAQPFGSSVK